MTHDGPANSAARQRPRWSVRRTVRQCLDALLVGAFATWCLACLVAVDLASVPSSANLNNVIGATVRPNNRLATAWRSVAPGFLRVPESMRDSIDIPPDDGTASVGMIVTDDTAATVTITSGAFDILTVERVAATGAWREHIAREFEARLTLLARRTSPPVEPETTDTPAWIRASSPSCMTVMPERCRGPERWFEMIGSDPAAWTPVGRDTAPADASHVPAATVVRRIDETRIFGWPLRAFAVHGARASVTEYDENGEATRESEAWCSNGLDPSMPNVPLPMQIETLPAVGLPWKPLWLPFLANSLILGVPLTLAGVGVSRAARAGLTKFRGRGGKCPRCGYPRKGLARGAACPECGGE